MVTHAGAAERVSRRVAERYASRCEQKKQPRGFERREPRVANFFLSSARLRHAATTASALSMLAAAGPSAHVDDERAGKRQRIHEVRSRRGCLTCRRRKKKCPEDMVVRGDGLPSCSACHGRGERCEWASAGLGSDRAPVPPQEQPISIHQTVPPPLSPPLALPSEDGALVDGFLLDDFFRDYVGLSETLLAGFDPSDSFLSTPSSVASPAVATREQGRPASAAPRRSEGYDRIVRSDDLDGLLSKYSPMCEWQDDKAGDISLI